MFLSSYFHIRMLIIYVDPHSFIYLLNIFYFSIHSCNLGNTNELLSAHGVPTHLNNALSLLQNSSQKTDTIITTATATYHY